MSKSIESNPDHDHFSFVESEHDILEFWEREAIFQQSLDQTKGGAPYIFYDGPPFATGLPHHGHLVGSILKDVVPRYFTMQGRYVQSALVGTVTDCPLSTKSTSRLACPRAKPSKN